jgi:hypothetical protein
MSKLIVSIDDKLHQAFRIKCLKEHRTMKDKLTEFISQEVGDLLEMDKKTLRKFLMGKEEIQKNNFITLEEAKKKFKINLLNM